MRFSEFCSLLSEIEQENSRNLISLKLSRFLARLSEEEIEPTIYMLQGRLSPMYVDINFGISNRLVKKALEDLFRENFKRALQRSGDMGDAVYELKKSRLDNELNTNLDGHEDRIVTEIFSILKSIAIESGKGSIERKISLYLDTIRYMDSNSAKFFTRILLGELRLGVSDKTIIDSLSFYFCRDKSLSEDLVYAYGVDSDLSKLVRDVIRAKASYTPVEELKKTLRDTSPRVGLPVASKLVERESSTDGVWNRMSDCLVQPKLDGLRGQIHYDFTEQSVFIFSRNQENLTSHFPEIIREVDNLGRLGIRSIILDSEIISFDEETGRYGSYQATMSRRRKYEIDSYSVRLPVAAFCFDILYLNGVSLLHETTKKRIDILNDVFEKLWSLGGSKHLKLLQTWRPRRIDELNKYFSECIENGLEGVIVKALNSTYQPGTRNFDWIKLKYNIFDSKVDTLDVLVMGYYEGSGVRSKFGFGALLCGLIGNDDKVYTVAKVGSGFDEQNMAEISSIIRQLKVLEPHSSYEYEKSLKPDGWLMPGLVIEVSADEITRSPVHTAGRGVQTSISEDDTSKGLSLRFPRIKRIRYDRKDPNTVEELIQMYKLRKSV